MVDAVSGTATLVLGNASDSPIRVRAHDAAGEVEEFDLDPYASRTLARSGRCSLPLSEGTVEALRLEVNGPVGSVRAWGVVTSAEERFVSPIRFYDPAGIRQPHLFATGVRVQNVTMHLVLKNTTDVPISVRPRFIPLSPNSSDVVEGPSVTLGPREAREVSLTSLLPEVASARLERVSLQVVNESGILGLIGALVGQDRITRLTYEVPLRDPGPIRNSTGSYPWRTDGDHTTVVSITNVGDRPAQVIVTINFPGGQYFLYPRELAVGETALFDLRRIQRERIPDSLGRTIPLSVSMGQFRWSVHGRDATARLIGRSEIVSLSRRVSSSYSCPVCCPYSFLGIALRPPLFILPPRGSLLVMVDGFEMDCYGNVIGPFPSGADECQNHNSAALTAWLENGNIRVEGVSEGTATIVAFRYDIIYSDDGMDCYPFWTRFADDCDGEIVNPKISISEAVFDPDRIPVQNGETTLRITLAVSTTVPSGTRVTVEAYQATAPDVELRIFPSDGKNSVSVTGGNPAQVSFLVRSSATNTRSGEVTFKVRIFRIESSDPRVTVEGEGDEKDSDRLHIGG